MSTVDTPRAEDLLVNQKSRSLDVPAFVRSTEDRGMLGDEISDPLWDRLFSKMSGETCPSCRQKLDRHHVEVQPCETRVRVKCRRCGYVYMDDGNGVISAVDEPARQKHHSR